MLHLRHWGTPPAAICNSKIGKLWPAQLAPPPAAPPPPSGSSFLPAVSIVIQLLALSTRLLRRPFWPLPPLRFDVWPVLRVSGAGRQSCASLGHTASLARHWGTPPVASRCASPRLLDSRNACPHHLRHLHAIVYPWRRIAGFAVPRTSAKVFL